MLGLVQAAETKEWDAVIESSTGSLVGTGPAALLDASKLVIEVECLLPPLEDPR